MSHDRPGALPRTYDSGAIRRIAAVCALALLAQGVLAAPRAGTLEALAHMDLEELMAVETDSVTGLRQPRGSVPAALTVLTAEDIRTSGVTSLPEALRLVPGLHVARINASSWVIGARGMGGIALTDTRYLVMLDGRVVFDPTISTTNWDAVDTPLADIERIEVIRGPGATLWGINAMNGVINIVTQSAASTQGASVSTSVGTLERTITTARYGGTLRNGLAYRVWGKYQRHGDFENDTGESVRDDWASTRVGFRVDYALDDSTTFTAHGDAYRLPVASSSVLLPVPGEDRVFERVNDSNRIDGGYVSARIHRQAGESGWALQAYADRTRRDTPRVGVTRETADADFRQWTRWSDANEAIWGLRLNHSDDDVSNGPGLIFDPPTRSLTTVHAFLQNTTELVPDRWFLMLGNKVTDHEFVGIHHQPSVRLWWTGSSHTVWGAVSRALRVPSRLEEEGLLVFSYVDLGALGGGAPNGVIVPLGVAGNDLLRVEPVTAYELGHRWKISPQWAVGTSLFYNDYDRLISAPPTLFGQFTDAGWGRTYGMELAIAGRLSERWRIDASYYRNWTRIRGPIYDFATGQTPGHRMQLRTSLQLGPQVELHGALFHAGKIRASGIDNYTRADLGLTWRLRNDLDLAIWGQNLMQTQHREATGAEVPRSAYAQLTYRFGD